MQIGIICVGHMGGTVARHWAKLGHDMRIANSRGPGTLTATGKNRVVVLARDKLSAQSRLFLDTCDSKILTTREATCC